MAQKKLVLLCLACLGTCIQAQEPEEAFDRGFDAFEAKNYQVAAKLWLKAAKEGHVRAQNGLGVLYRDGLGVDQNPKKAISWFYMSADNGYAYGMDNLASIYIDQGRSRDMEVEAYKWLFIATAINFDERANYKLYLLSTKLARSEILQAQDGAQSWFDDFFFGR